MQSKDLIGIVFGIVLSGVLTVIFALSDWRNNFQLNNLLLVWLVILLLFLIILIIAWIFYMRIREAENDLVKQSAEQKRMEEKLKIHEQLVDMKADIKELQRGCLKNEKRK
jgi:predicted PurR-regulated permease PerM